MYPASSLPVVSLLLTQLQVAINTLKTSGVEIQPQVEESLESVQGLIKHLKERSREGVLRSDKDTYALLPTGGNDLFLFEMLLRKISLYPALSCFENCHKVQYW